MKNDLRAFFILFISFLLLISCSKKKNSDFISVDTSSPYDFHTIELFEENIYATGGDVWNKSMMVSSPDGETWDSDSLTNKSIFDLYSDDAMLYAVGNDGYIFSGKPNLQLTRTKHWGLLRSITSSTNGFITVGGKNFNKGWIYKVNSDLVIDTTFNFNHEILDVLCPSTNVCLACGYGLILRSIDDGLSWRTIDETGDYYNSIAKNENGDLYIVGYEGTVIRSIDNGETWEKVKNGHSPIGKNNPFRKIKFDGKLGIIIGDHGLILISRDSGYSWKEISIDTQLDFFDFIFFNNRLIIVSEKGSIFSVNL